MYQLESVQIYTPYIDFFIALVAPKKLGYSGF